MQYTSLTEHELPWIPRWYAQWLVGIERGCATVCRCRPTARRARQVLTAARWFVYVSELVSKELTVVARHLLIFGICFSPQ